MRIWSNGKISLCQGEDAGSIPAIRPFSCYMTDNWYIVDHNSVVVLSSFFLPSAKIRIFYEKGSDTDKESCRKKNVFCQKMLRRQDLNL